MWGSGATSEREAQSHSGCAARPPALLQQLCRGAPSSATHSAPGAGRGAFLPGAAPGGGPAPRSAGTAGLAPCPGRGLCRPGFPVPVFTSAASSLPGSGCSGPCLGAGASRTAPGGPEANVARQRGMVRPTVTPENDGAGAGFFISRLILFHRRLVPRDEPLLIGPESQRRAGDEDPAPRLLPHRP